MKVYLAKKAYGTVAVDLNMLSPPLPWNGGYGGITLISGGTAVQSARSIALQILEESEVIPITYIHTSRIWPIPFQEEIEALSESFTNLKTHFFYTGKEEVDNLG